MKLRAALAVAGALPLLGGCVAAAALPFVAAGGIARSQAGERARDADAPPRVALPAEQPAAAAVDPAPASEPASAGPIVRDYAFADGSTVTVTNAVGTSARAATREAEPAPAAAGQSLAPAAILSGMTELPPPAAATATARAPASSSAFAEFAAYARAQAAIPAAGSERRSAMLDDSARLAPTTRICSIHPAAVLIDLDRAGGSGEDALATAGDPTLAAALAELRREGVEIGWISGRTADRAGEVRRALSASGLDPEGRDELVLLRLPGERKQTRREDFAQSHCVLAIAGDERADFDELFGYLRDPTAASPLDALIGRGWFLVPPPLG